MGYGANGVRVRICSSCDKFLFVSAKELVEHAKLCERAKKAGLVLSAGISKPDSQIVTLD